MLIVVGYLMMQSVGEIVVARPRDRDPRPAHDRLMPFTYSITNGVGAGFMAYVVIRLTQGKAKEVHPLLYVVAAIFAWYFVQGVLA